MCHSLQRPHLSGVLWGGSEFSSVVKIFLENVAHLGPFFFGEKKKKREVRPRDGHVEHVRVQKFRVYFSKTAWTFGILCVKMSKNRYFLQITWFLV